ncbi:MAG: 16S rRNA (guanine(966)-N(2))-methyltransferase RsmD [Xanthomonadaceae bacterium]|nr:16S rRNA (guanine(966)-N(2))-methyltransferase RsmD [Xanthomonadaceae bacterium]
MKVTGGNRRGLVLEVASIPQLRPTKAMVREAIFSVIGAESIRNALVADLFAGSGILAIEALSRGAKAAWCIDNATASCRLIEKNLEKAHFQELCQVINLTVARFIQGKSVQSQCFDLIFMDPPYNYPARDRTIELIAVDGILSPSGILIVEHDYREVIKAPLPLVIWKQKRYGKSSVTFIICQNNKE